MIADMLKEGIIAPSRSPFSPPIILVKKKDGTWIFWHTNYVVVTLSALFPNVVNELTSLDYI